MKRWLLSAMLLGALPLVLIAFGGSAEAPVEAAAPVEQLPPEEPEPAEMTETQPAEEPAATESANSTKKQSAKSKNDHKQAKKKKAKKKQRQVAVALGEPAEFDLVPAKARVKAGKVTFKLKNTGSIEHEMIVIRTDLDSGELPTDKNGAAVEHGAVAPHGSGHEGGEHSGAHVGTHVAAGEAASLTVKLEPGSYALVCNLPGHYAGGMHSNFTVVA